jgi:DNA-binding transcriptional LysR family regulator
MSKAKLSKTRWSGISIAELLFLEKLGATLSSGDTDRSMLQVAKRAGFNYSHLHNTLIRLESLERFNRKLVHRETAKLTRDGIEALGYARKVLSAYRLQPFQNNRVTLRIAATNRILTTMLAPNFQTFCEKYKQDTGNDIDIEILETSFEQSLQLLETAEVELAFGAGNDAEKRHRKLVARPLINDLQIVLIVPRQGMYGFTKRRENEGKKASVAELKRANLCLIRRDFRDSFSQEIPPAPGFSRIIVDNYSSVISMVQAEAAVGLVVDIGVPRDLLKFSLAESHLSKQIFAVWQHVDAKPSAAAGMLWENVVNQPKRRRTSRRKP